jgi:hypothetical protein
MHKPYHTWEQKHPQPAQYLVPVEAEQHYIVRFCENANTFFPGRNRTQKQGFTGHFAVQKRRET